MQGSEDEKMAAPGATVSAVRRHLRKRVAAARSEVVMLVRLALRGAPPAEDSTERGPYPER